MASITIVPKFILLALKMRFIYGKNDATQDDATEQVSDGVLL